MRPVYCAVCVLLGTSFLHAQVSVQTPWYVPRPAPQAPAQSATERAAVFHDADFVPLGNADGVTPETYTIGEYTQSYATKRAVTPFSINRYETTYQLWYDVRIRAEKIGYVFQNPGQEARTAGGVGRRRRAATNR